MLKEAKKDMREITPRRSKEEMISLLEDLLRYLKSDPAVIDGHVDSFKVRKAIAALQFILYPAAWQNMDI